LPMPAAASCVASKRTRRKTPGRCALPSTPPDANDGHTGHPEHTQPMLDFARIQGRPIAALIDSEDASHARTLIDYYLENYLRNPSERVRRFCSD
jgi:hypothetical protein